MWECVGRPATFDAVTFVQYICEDTVARNAERFENFHQEPGHVEWAIIKDIYNDAQLNCFSKSDQPVVLSIMLENGFNLAILWLHIFYVDELPMHFCLSS